MKAKLLILMILVMFISSCGAHKTPQSEEKDSITRQLSFINNKNIDFSIRKVACDSCFPIIDIGYRVKVKLSAKQESLIAKLKKNEWMHMLNNETTDYAANILLYYIYKRDAIVLLYNRDIRKWRDGMKSDDILYWNHILK